MEITDLLLNFHSLLCSIARSLQFFDRYHGSDEWDELTELAYKLTVCDPIEQKIGVKFEGLYEGWGICPESIHVKVNPHSGIQSAQESMDGRYVGQFFDKKVGDTALEFYFIRFGIPFHIDEEFLRTLSYVTGMTKNKEVICAKLQDCKFFMPEGLQ
jgi:hypothetical protein